MIKDLTQDVVAALLSAGEDPVALTRIADGATVPEFRRALKSDLAQLKGVDRLVIALDEIEYVCQPARVDIESANGAEITQFLGCLRSIVQETDRFSFLIAGITPDIFRRGMLFGRDNPLFSWVTPRYVRPFTEVEAGEMLQALGRRMGLRWETNAVGLAVSRAGGHAYMLRALGAVAASRFEASDDDRIVTADLIQDCIPEWRMHVRPNISESIAHVARYYALESRMLERFRSQGEAGAPMTDRLAQSPAFNNLLNLGLVVEDNTPKSGSSTQRARAVDFLLD